MHFGVKFFVNGKQYMHRFSPFEYTSCYRFMDSLHYRLLHRDNWYALDSAIPAMTSHWILDSLHDCLCQIRNLNFKIFQPIFSLTYSTYPSWAIGTRLPNHAQWIHTLSTNKELLLVWQLVNNPLLINNKSLCTINHNFHSALQHSLIVVENNWSIYHEPISHTGLYTRLTIEFQKNSTMSFSLHFTLIWQAAIWTHTVLYTVYVCAIIGRVCTPKSRRCVLHAHDVPLLTPQKENHPNWCIIYPSKLHSGCCTWMPIQPTCTLALKVPSPTSSAAVACALFGILEPVTGATTSTFASTIMKMQLSFGFCHTVVLD